MSPTATLILRLVGIAILALLSLASRILLIVVTVIGMRWWSRRRERRNGTSGEPIAETE
jgi:hypothetical protein